MNTRRIVLTFFLVGVVALAGAVLFAGRTAMFLASSETVTGTVVRNVYQAAEPGQSHRVGSYHPQVRFRTRNGETVDFVSKLGTNPAQYVEGDTVEVAYDPLDPTHAEIRDFSHLYLGPLLMGGLGVAFTIPYVLGVRSRRRAKWLQHNGWRVLAEVTQVEVDPSVRINGRNPYRIVCSWREPSTNQVRIFKSDHIWYDPTRFIRDKQLGVFIDLSDPKQYWVDTAFLEKDEGKDGP